MKKRDLMQLLDSYVEDDAEVLIGETPKCLMAIKDDVCLMIRLDGKWEY